MKDIEHLLGWVANLIQVATFVFTLWVLWRTRRRLKRYIQRAKTVDSAAPMALAIGLGGSIEGAVRQYLNSHELAAVQIRPYEHKGFVPKSRFYKVLHDLQRIKQELTDLGVTEVHLFYKGPVTLALGIGSLFDNWVPVKVYELNKQTGQYELDIVLGKGAVLELLEDTAMVGEDALAEALTSR